MDYPLNMDLEKAIEEFQFKRKGRYSTKDLAIIRSICSELELSDFVMYVRKNIRYKGGDSYVERFYDSADKVHFHSTMIVSRHEFTGCYPDEKSKYKDYPYKVELSSWHSTEAILPICPKCFIEFPLTGQCDFCGLDLDNFEDE